jgi:hypothetical protein
MVSKQVKMLKNGTPSPILLEINRVAIFFRVSQIYALVALEKDYRMNYVRTLVIFVFKGKYSMKDKIK